MKAEHPDRPPRPARMIPLAGDDNRAFFAWRDQCDTCRHGAPEGCLEAGVVQYGSGRTRPLRHRGPGGCSRWEPKRHA